MGQEGRALEETGAEIQDHAPLWGYQAKKGIRLQNIIYVDYDDTD